MNSEAICKTKKPAIVKIYSIGLKPIVLLNDRTLLENVVPLHLLPIHYRDSLLGAQNVLIRYKNKTVIGKR